VPITKSPTTTTLSAEQIAMTSEPAIKVFAHDAWTARRIATQEFQRAPDLGVEMQKLVHE